MNVHKLNFDTAGNVENITFVLAYKSGEKIGNITNVTNIVTKHPLSSYSEFSFTAHKKIDNNTITLWDKITDFKLVWIPEWDMWFEITVELNDNDETIKNVSGITIGEAELSQIMLYNIEINTETDIARDEYVKPTIFYNPSDKSSSLVDRLMEKAPHFKFVHIDSSLMNIQRTYTFDGKSIYDVFKEIEKEMNCLFVFHSGSNEDGSIQRGISVFDLEANCLSCGHRNTFVDKCPVCGSTNVKNGFGEYTNVFISKKNLATEITYSTDTDSVKNCFKLEAGDDLMTAAIRSCNPNGTDYIYYFPDKVRQDMSMELQTKLDSYDKLYDEYQQTHKFNIDSTFVDRYNTLVGKYKTYEDTLTPIALPIVGYPKLTKIYFDTIDMAMFLKHRLMPNITKPENTAKGQGDHLVSNLPPLAATTSLKSLSVTTANNIIITLANSIVKGAFKITIVNSTLSNNIWRGSFKINSYADETDVYTTPAVSITITENYEEYVKQRLDKLLNSEDKNYYDIVGLFKQNLEVFKSELRKYCLTSLATFQKCCQSCIDIMVQQGISSTAQKNQIFDGSDLYNKLYTPYYQKLNAIQNEIITRENEIEVIEGYYNNQNELVRSGLQIEIEKAIEAAHEALNFEKYIGKKLHGEFCSFVRMDKYSNSNYISDGLNNTDLLKNALDFMVTAQKELFKSATLQHSISGNLKNLLLMKEFRPIVNSFKNGNWILAEVDGTVYQLRIIEYTIDFSNNKIIDVRFSDVVSTADGLSDLESILNNAANMTKSYTGIIKQSEINTNFRKDMSEMIIKGLDMTNTKIVSNADNQDITWDEHGLLCREYNDILSDYNPCQLKIINHGVYLTTNKWKTAKAGIGRFFYFDPKDKKYKEGYGVIADTLVGNLILSSEVGIYNEEKSIEMDKNGIVVTTNTYNKNVFTIQKELKDSNGNISYQRQLYIDDNGNIVLGGGASISWENVTGTGHIATNADIEAMKDNITKIFNQKISLLEKQTDKKAETWYQATDPSTSWAEQTEKDKHQGDLWFNTTEDKSYSYDSATGKWNELKTTPPKEVFDAIDGKAQIFVNQPRPPYNVGDLWFDSTTSDIMTCITKRDTGVFNASDWEKRNKYTDNTELNNFVNNTYPKDLQGIQAQIDGQIETFYYDYEPTLQNIPASQWATEVDKEKHVGDLFFWKSKGFAYRFLKDGVDYVWQLVKDTDVTTALQNAQKAQDTADGKRRVFVATPTPPYDVGDLWTQGANGKLMRCKTAKATGTYEEIHWENAVGYDQELKKFIDGQYFKDYNLLKNQIDGLVQTFRQEADPSLSWTVEEKAKHVGDLWFNTKTQETFMYNGTGWDAVKGEIPQELWDKIDGKAKIFTTEPKPPYHLNDLWVQGLTPTTITTGDIMKCVKQKTLDTDIFDPKDWEKACKYTDDTKVNDVIEGLGFTTQIDGTKVVSPNIIGGQLSIGVPGGAVHASIDSSGKLTATGVDVRGKIIATEGTIGAFNISNAIWSGMNSFNSGSNGVYLGTDGIALGGGSFTVGNDGTLLAEKGTFAGNVIARNITAQKIYKLNYTEFGMNNPDVITKEAQTIVAGSFEHNNRILAIGSAIALRDDGSLESLESKSKSALFFYHDAYQNTGYVSCTAERFDCNELWVHKDIMTAHGFGIALRQDNTSKYICPISSGLGLGSADGEVNLGTNNNRWLKVAAVKGDFRDSLALSGVEIFSWSDLKKYVTTTGTTYTAGNGISISASNEISVNTKYLDNLYAPKGSTGNFPYIIGKGLTTGNPSGTLRVQLAGESENGATVGGLTFNSHGNLMINNSYLDKWGNSKYITDINIYGNTLSYTKNGYTTDLNLPGGGGNVDLTGYATERWVESYILNNGSSTPVRVMASDNVARPPITTGTGSTQKVAYITTNDEVTAGGTTVRFLAQFGSTRYSRADFVFSTSDIRLKTNISNTDKIGLDLINAIKLRQFNWKNNGQHQSIGMIADELEQLDRNLTCGGGYDEDGNVCIKTINTFYLQGYEIKAIQELGQTNIIQQREIQELKSTLLRLQGELSILEQKLGGI